MERKSIAFVWQGVSDSKVFEHWNDGLREAMRHIEKNHEVKYFEPYQDIHGVDVILYWEAPCTINHPVNGNYYRKVMSNPIRKALLFAGGPMRKDYVVGFNLLFVESKVNVDECHQLGIPYMTAFGINERVFTPKNKKKKYDGIHHGTCASWKRQWLVGEALHEKGLLVGKKQETDTFPFDKAAKESCNVMKEKSQEDVCDLINESYCLVQTSDKWGGGQRATLEAMACNVPVICMTDSQKNREYVEESGFGMVIDPGVELIKKAVDKIKTWPTSNKGREYIESKWTSKHYAESLIEGINIILK